MNSLRTTVETPRKWPGLLAHHLDSPEDHPVDLVFNFGSSGDLSKQIVAAAKAHVFLSADEKEMEVVQTAGLVAAGSRRALLSNQLSVIEPLGGTSHFTEPFAPAQLAAPAIQRLSLGDPATVPAGPNSRCRFRSADHRARVQRSRGTNAPGGTSRGST